MRVVVLMLLVVGAVSGVVSAQPKEGDLVFTVSQSSPTTLAYVGYLDPTNPGTVTTLAIAPANGNFARVRMASDNTDLIVGMGQTSGFGGLSVVRPNGSQQQTLATFLGNLEGFELDHDGLWIASANYSDQNSYRRLLTLCGLDTSSYPGRNQAFWFRLGTFLGAQDDLAIDRDPGAGTYCVGESWASYPAPGGWRLIRGDRQGNVTTITQGKGGYSGSMGAVELHPRSGDYLATWAGGLGQSPFVARVSKSGRMTKLPGPWWPMDAARITQDDRVWCAGTGTGPHQILEYDLTHNVVVTMINVNAASVTGIEIYGSRRLVSYQPPTSPNTVTVKIQSRDATAPGASYVLAASFARRPGLKFANGEWLDLNTSDPLFLVTASNLLPGIFRGFRGTLDQHGNATATVNIPPGLPKLGDMAVFVAGVIYKGSNVLQVTNSHWFVLP